MAQANDPYSVLGVAPTASEGEIRKAFRNLAKKHHPDMNPGDKAAEDKFKKITQAYDIVGDTTKRKQFDAGEIGPDGAARAPNFGAGFGGGAGAGSPFGFNTRTHAGFGGAGAGFGGFNPNDIHSMFADMMGGAQRSRAPTPGEDVRYRLSVTLEDVARGETRRVTLSDGQTLDVAVPVGIEDGKTLRLRGKGRPSPNGGPAGDALVEISIEKHPRFTRDDLNITTDLPITLGEAVLGAKVPVTTLTGQVMVTVPKNSSSGAMLRLKGKGIHSGSKTGDFYIRLMIHLPEHPDPALSTWVEGWAAEHAYTPKGR